MIQIDKLHFGYGKRGLLFDNLNLSVQPGSISGVLGKNGAGKTSLLKIIAGLVFPKSGNVDVLGCIPRKRNVASLQRLFYVAEEFYLPSLTISDFVQTNSVFYPSFDLAKLHGILQEFELDKAASINKISYGQKKKLLIAFALATNCSLLLLDEPTNGLDIPSKAVFRKVMAGNLNGDQTVLISTHQVKDVENLIDRIIFLNDGQVVLDKSIDEITDQLLFFSSSEAHNANAVYTEPILGGYKHIGFRDDPQVFSELDFELLFNAVLNRTNLFQEENQILTN